MRCVAQSPRVTIVIVKWVRTVVRVVAPKGVATTVFFEFPPFADLLSKNFSKISKNPNFFPFSYCRRAVFSYN